ncbi:MAG: hypothetical protein HY819_11920 [Acidobacteria bacterium]|nr:hypothetical protein [Acidobacteriota bacterium]
MFCSSCGSQNPPQLRFCRACGKPISSAETLAADGDDPLKTRLSIPAEHANFANPAPQPSAGDPMATVVGMQAVKPNPTPNSSAPDPFATQTGGPALNVAQLKELAAKSAANKAPAHVNNEPDSMATVVGMQAVKLPVNQPSNAEVDPLKTVVGPPKTPPAPAVDPLATVVGMQAVDAATLAALSKSAQPQKAPEPITQAPKQPDKPLEVKPKAVEQKPILPPPNPEPVHINFSRNVEQNNSSNTMIFVVIGIVVVIIIIAVVLFTR